MDAATREPTRDLWTLVGGDPAVIGMYEADIGVALDQDALDLYRLCWDLTEIALYLSDLRHPHERTDDTDTAWRGLQEYLGPGRGRTG